MAQNSPSVSGVSPGQTNSLFRTSGKTLTQLKRWHRKATTDYKKTIHGFAFWMVGIFLFVVNWIWLQVFTLLYIKHADCNLNIFVAGAHARIPCPSLTPQDLTAWRCEDLTCDVCLSLSGHVYLTVCDATAVLTFNGPNYMMKLVVVKVMEQAEISRIGSKLVGFDCFQLHVHVVGLTRFAFHCYSAVYMSMYRHLMFAQLKDWEGFWVF